jgi:hypothetical protein
MEERKKKNGKVMENKKEKRNNETPSYVKTKWRIGCEKLKERKGKIKLKSSRFKLSVNPFTMIDHGKLSNKLLLYT